MGQGTRAGGQAVNGHGGQDPHERGPDEIREEIERTREELGETVEALAAKTDVKARSRAKLDDTKRRARAAAEDPATMRLVIGAVVAVAVVAGLAIARR